MSSTKLETAIRALKEHLTLDLRRRAFGKEFNETEPLGILLKDLDTLQRSGAITTEKKLDLTKKLSTVISKNPTSNTLKELAEDLKLELSTSNQQSAPNRGGTPSPTPVHNATQAAPHSRNPQTGSSDSDSGSDGGWNEIDLNT